MASWVIHTMVAEQLLKMIPGLDARGFVVGNIAPDCNVENEDWTQFTPPRDVTHWMAGEGKVSADYEAFYSKYVRPGLPKEQYSFYIGYYSHLITDAQYQIFLRDPDRVQNCFERAKKDEKIKEMISGMPEEFDTLKKMLGRKRMEYELRCLEAKWLRANPDNLYEGLLCGITGFPDYLDYLPAGAITRKVRLMQDDHTELIPPDIYVFYIWDELEKFVEDTARAVYMRISRHGGWKMKAMKYLQEAAEEAVNLAEMVDVFRNMCHMPIGAEKEQLLFEAGVFSLPVIPEYRRGDIEECETAAELVTEFMEMEEQEMDIDQLLFPETETMFNFSLVRQFPDVEDEFFQIHMDVKFDISDYNRNLSATIWSDQVEGDFFDAVLASDVLKQLSKEEIQDVCVYIDVT